MCLRFLAFIMGLAGCVQTTLDGTVILDIEVQPKASRQGITGINEWRGKLQVAVKAEAQKGKANFAVCNLLKTILSTDVEVVSGQTSRIKRIRVHDLDSQSVISKLRGHIES